MAWEDIDATETDANSPLTQTLFDKIRGNLDHLNSSKTEIVMLDGPEDLSASWDTDWTSLTISTEGSEDAEFAIVELRVGLYCDSGSSGSKNAYVEARGYGETGWTEFGSACASAYAQLGSSPYVYADGSDRNVVFVPVDSSNRFQYRCGGNCGAQTVEVIQLGYGRKL